MNLDLFLPDHPVIPDTMHEACQSRKTAEFRHSCLNGEQTRYSSIRKVGKIRQYLDYSLSGGDGATLTLSPASQMALDRIHLSHFRNHVESELSGTAQFNLLVGENGAGKTNILEGLSLLAPGRGLRRAALAD
ncbi:AAA family ATPase, partial [Segeticoccus rhizosphaerae]|uniref:AAA family ATPase n=1 Tax=Segeticoccus rhizosphaerae TaxID=1104777 RepID=UPI001939E1CB